MAIIEIIISFNGFLANKNEGMVLHRLLRRICGSPYKHLRWSFGVLLCPPVPVRDKREQNLRAELQPLAVPVVVLRQAQSTNAQLNYGKLRDAQRRA